MEFRERLCTPAEPTSILGEGDAKLAGDSNIRTDGVTMPCRICGDHLRIPPSSVTMSFTTAGVIYNESSQHGIRIEDDQYKSSSLASKKVKNKCFVIEQKGYKVINRPLLQHLFMATG
ncbi:hypothetical protein RB195_007326 [Necator americanus]|uniref:Uncharacterized protein n=1 Tax=Necator americanus TaxID=51031 RepID=A0ABR1C015_NECAM